MKTIKTVLILLLLSRTSYAENVSEGGHWGLIEAGGGGGGGRDSDEPVEIDDDTDIEFGTGTDVICRYDTAQTTDALVCGLSTDSERLILTTKALVGTDFGFGDADTPRLTVTDTTGTSFSEYGANRVSLALTSTTGAVIKSTTNVKADVYRLDEVERGAIQTRVFQAKSQSGSLGLVVFLNQTSTNASMVASTSVDALMIGVGSNLGRHLAIGDNSWVNAVQDTDVGVFTYPTLTLWSDTPNNNNQAYASISKNADYLLLKTQEDYVFVDDDLDVSGQLTVLEYTHDVDLSAGAIALGPTAPAQVFQDTVAALSFTTSSQLVGPTAEIDDCWVGDSDLTLKTYIMTEATDAMVDTEVIKFDCDYRSLDVGTHKSNQSTLVSVSVTYTQSGPGTDSATIEPSVTIDHDDTFQPIVSGYVFAAQCNRDTAVGNNYSGAALLFNAELSMQCDRIPNH